MVDTTKEHFKIRMKKILRLYNSIKHTKVLDIGCDNGYLLKKLKEANSNTELYGCDINSLKGFNMKVCDIENGLPYKDNKFDVIFLCEVIEHLKKDKFVLSEIRRCIKEEGHLILTTPNVTSFQKRIQFLLGIVPFDLNYDEHIRFNNFNTITEKLERIGFKVIKKLTNNIPYPIKFKFFKAIAVKLGNYFYSFGNQIIIEAKLNNTL